MQILLDNGACLEVKDDDGDTPLLTAVRMEFYALATFLIGKGANPEQSNKTESELFTTVMNIPIFGSY